MDAQYGCAAADAASSTSLDPLAHPRLGSYASIGGSDAAQRVGFETLFSWL